MYELEDVAYTLLQNGGSYLGRVLAVYVPVVGGMLDIAIIMFLLRDSEPQCKEKLVMCQGAPFIC